MVDPNLLTVLLPELLREADKMDHESKKKLYWIFSRTKKRGIGPYSAEGLAKLKSFHRNSRVAPYSATNKGAWKAAKEYPELLPFLKGI